MKKRFELNFNHYTISIRLIYQITFILIMLKEAIAQLQRVFDGVKNRRQLLQQNKV